MRPRNIAILACRVLALFIGSEAIVAIVGFLVATHGQVGVGSFWAFELTQLFIALLLWFAAGSIGGMMAWGTTDESSGATPRPFGHVLAGAIAVVGLVMV